jgi:hypothetical protein
MEMVIDIEQSQNNPNKERRLEKFKQVLERERRAECLELAHAIVAERPDYLTLSKDERQYWILNFLVKQEIWQTPTNDFRLSAFIHALCALRQKMAEERVDRLYPDCTPEERDMTIQVYLQEGGPN